MSEINTTNLNAADMLNLRLQGVLNETASEKIQRLNEQIEKLPSVLDYDTLSKLKNNEYEISLKEYTDMSTYNTIMNSVYGNKSADSFKNYMENVFESDDDKIANAKNFIDKMRENGLSNRSAVKLYTALKTYSLVSSFKNYNFVNAKI